MDYGAYEPIMKNIDIFSSLFGHIARFSGLAVAILQGTVKGKRRSGRQKKKWEDNIKEWTWMDLASTTSAAGIKTWSRGHKTFFMLSSIEHEIFPLHVKMAV